jgi:hypothetical protein
VPKRSPLYMKGLLRRQESQKIFSWCKRKI